jgi:hypothetical protein
MKNDLIIALNAIEQKHDVELALADDIKKAIDAALTFKDKKKQAYNKASTPLIALFDTLRAELGAANTAQRGIADLKAKTAALGVEMPAKMLQNEKTINDILNNTKSKVTQLDKFIQALPNLSL